MATLASATFREPALNSQFQIHRSHTCLSKILDVFFCKQNSKKGEKKSIRILERRYSIDFEKSACEKGIYNWNQEITKSKQTSVYKWQCECEYPPSSDSVMTPITLTLPAFRQINLGLASSLCQVTKRRKEIKDLMPNVVICFKSLTFS